MIRNIVQYPAPVLAEQSAIVISLGEVTQALIDDMFETMYACRGIGLAANQVGYALQIAVIDLQQKGQRNPFCIINPTIEEYSGTISIAEGCLSLAGHHIEKVRRSKTIIVNGLDRNGKSVRYKAEGLLACCLQHEIDHLGGRLYIDRLPAWRKRRVVNSK